MTYEELQRKYGDELCITETDLSNVNGLKGLYVDGCVAIEKNMMLKEKGCVLAEEVGHHLTSVGDILMQDNTNNRRQERKARIVGYNIQIGLYGLINAYKAGCKNSYEVAEYLDVTEAFLQDAVKYYKDKYGLLAKVDGYIIYFEPSLGVMEMI
ncbi:MAG: hypothetical protein E7255_08465 [Lachnospiraceae bacterium]|nr:hypothetical protein [Lachnospiraceae bacterium]